MSEYGIDAIGVIYLDTTRPECAAETETFIRTARQVFVLTDTDGSGYISDSELNIMMQYLKLRGAPDMRPDCIKSENDEIDFTEFNHCLFHSLADTSSQNMDLTQSVLDRDGDGEISS